MWAEKAVFYHLYPIGFCGAYQKNQFAGIAHNNFYKIKQAIDHLKYLGINAVYFGPLCQSTYHGYDTADYYKIDERLGDEAEFAALCQALHAENIRVVPDGVFNHVGRDFWAFRDVLQNKQNSKYVNWFFINWEEDNCYNDGFSYKDWSGYTDLVKLNLHNDEVVAHVFEAIRSWVEKFDIDGLRLDVADCLDKDFMKKLRAFSKELKDEFWLMGEVAHGDYNHWVNPEMLHSVTNYELFKGMYSSFNSKNMFEIAHSVKRQLDLYPINQLYLFVDNHDVSRVASLLKKQAHLPLVYSLMFALPGIPSVFYGSEFGYKAKKHDGDEGLRPAWHNWKESELTKHIRHLIELYLRHEVYALDQFKELKLTNEEYWFERSNKQSKLLFGVNISDQDQSFYDGGEAKVLHPQSAGLWIDNQRYV